MFFHCLPSGKKSSRASDDEDDDDFEDLSDLSDDEGIEGEDSGRYSQLTVLTHFKVPICLFWLICCAEASALPISISAGSVIWRLAGTKGKT